MAPKCWIIRRTSACWCGPDMSRAWHLQSVFLVTVLLLIWNRNQFCLVSGNSCGSGILSRAYMAWGANSSPESWHYNPSNLTAWEHEQIWNCIKTRDNSWQKDLTQEHSCKRTHERIWSRKRHLSTIILISWCQIGFDWIYSYNKTNQWLVIMRDCGHYWMVHLNTLYYLPSSYWTLCAVGDRTTLHILLKHTDNRYGSRINPTVGDRYSKGQIRNPSSCVLLYKFTTIQKFTG